MRIFLVGYMGCGKSLWGERLARKLNMEFVDLDRLIEQQQGLLIPELFDQRGEQYFREKEHNALCSVLLRDNVVVATGGGAPCFKENMSVMNDKGTTLFLNVDPEILAYRILNSSDQRPLVRNMTRDELIDYIKRHLQLRLPFYLQAHHIVDANNLNIDELTELFS